MPICLRLFLHCVLAAASRTFCTAGTSRLMRIAMMAITTSSSIRVKAERDVRGVCTAGPSKRCLEKSAVKRWDDASRRHIEAEDFLIVANVQTATGQGGDRKRSAADLGAGEFAILLVIRFE